MQNRERLLRAGVDLFREHGYAATSVEDLLEATGVARSNYYYHFDGKEGLARELALEWLSARAGALEELDAGRTGAQEDGGGDEPVRRVRRVLAAARGRGDGDGAVKASVALQLAPHDEEVRDSLSALLRKLEDRLADAVGSGATRSGPSVGLEPREAGRLGAVLLVGTLGVDRVFPGGDAPDAAASAVARLAAPGKAASDGRLAAVGRGI